MRCRLPRNDIKTPSLFSVHTVRKAHHTDGLGLPRVALAVKRPPHPGLTQTVLEPRPVCIHCRATSRLIGSPSLRLSQFSSWSGSLSRRGGSGRARSGCPAWPIDLKRSHQSIAAFLNFEFWLPLRKALLRHSLLSVDACLGAAYSLLGASREQVF